RWVTEAAASCGSAPEEPRRVQPRRPALAHLPVDALHLRHAGDVIANGPPRPDRQRHAAAVRHALDLAARIIVVAYAEREQAEDPVLDAIVVDVGRVAEEHFPESLVVVRQAERYGRDVAGPPPRQRRRQRGSL